MVQSKFKKEKTGLINYIYLNASNGVKKVENANFWKLQFEVLVNFER